MKKNNNLILIILLMIFILLFKFNTDVKMSIISSCKLWFYNLVPFMFSMYLIVDLLINYGLSKVLFKIFKSNRMFLIVISHLLGSPSNAKYISEFYSSGYINEKEANHLLLFCYSPNPLFIFGIIPFMNEAIFILGYIYLMNLIIALFSKKFFVFEKHIPRDFETLAFSECIEKSIRKGFNVLILILGIICLYGVVITLLDLLFDTPIVFKVFLEMTNAINECLKLDNYLPYVLLACSFGGLSIHTQIKSILEDTPINYKYFLFGRLISSISILFFAIIY